MKISAIKRLDLQDVPAEHREWFTKILDPLNQFMEQVQTALNGKLAFSDNFSAAIVQQKLTHNTAQVIANPLGGVRPVGVLPIRAVDSTTAATLIVTGCGFALTQAAAGSSVNGQLNVTMQFSAGGTTKGLTTLLVIGG